MLPRLSESTLLAFGLTTILLLTTKTTCRNIHIAVGVLAQRAALGRSETVLNPVGLFTSVLRHHLSASLSGAELVVQIVPEFGSHAKLAEGIVA